MDVTLHDNGEVCPSCELRREQENLKFTGRADVPCNNCGGTGRISYGAKEVCRRSAAWAVANYWPAREARWRVMNARN